MMVSKDHGDEHARRSVNFGESPLWVRLEGLPMKHNSIEVATRAFNNIGKLFFFDDAFKELGGIGIPRALIWPDLKQQMIPGIYFQYAENRSAWIDFRYEGVLILCSNCGVIGHKSNFCPITRTEAKERLFSYIAKNMGTTLYLLTEGGLLVSKELKDFGQPEST